MWNAVELLRIYSMINLEKGVSNVHRLVQKVIRLSLKNEGKEEGVLRETLKYINNCIVSGRSVRHITSVWNYASE
jgi:hypothetical protein